MSRFETVSGVDIVYEAVAPQIGIFWNPETNAGSIAFHVEHQEWRKPADGSLIFAGRAADQRVEMRPMTVPLERFIGDVLDIELPDGSTMQLPGGILVLAVKAAFNKYYEEKNAALEGNGSIGGVPVIPPADSEEPPIEVT